MAKKELTVSEFRAIIREEALKLKKRMVLENEKKALQSELRKLMSESYGEGELEEGFWGPDEAEIEANKQALSAQIDTLLAKVPAGLEIMGSKDEILEKAADANFKGQPWLRKSRTGKVVLGFDPELTRFQKVASAVTGGLRDGHTFGGGA